METENNFEHLSRKERREIHRQEQRQGIASNGRSRLVRRIGIWGIGALVIFGLGWGVIRLASTVQLPTTGGNLAVSISDADHIRGSANASITLVEYGDFQCPACGTFEPLVQQLFKEADLSSKLRLVYRHFPLTQIHKNAQISSQAAEAAGLQGKFWEMHDKLYESQAKWSGMSDKGARETFSGYAKDLGLDVTRFAKDIDSGAVKDSIARDVTGANQSAVDSTPTFFINGIHMPPINSYDQFKSYVTNGIQPTP